MVGAYYLKSYLRKIIGDWQQRIKWALRYGWLILLRKIILKILQRSFAIPVAIFIMCLRPLLFIRFGVLFNDRIGHFTGYTEMYLCERDAGVQGHNTLDIFYYLTRTHCNQQLAKMWKRNLRVISFAVVLDFAIRVLPGFKNHKIRYSGVRDVNGLLSTTATHLKFTSEEEAKGYKVLEGMGISKNTPFVCLHARDSAYLDHNFPMINWKYHDYLNTNINNYIKCAEELVKRGYVILRMGAMTSKRMITTNPKIIDYATIARSDFLDIFLEAKCSFHLGSPSGLSSVPEAFRRPRVIVNSVPLEYICTWNENEVFILKKMWLKRDHRVMTFREIVESGAGRFLFKEQYDNCGIEIVENTAQEIMDVAVEMDERLNGTWQTNEEDEKLQYRFWSLFPKSELHGKILSRIGTEFLRQNRELLEI